MIGIFFEARKIFRLGSLLSFELKWSSIHMRQVIANDQGRRILYWMGMVVPIGFSMRDKVSM